MYGTRFDMENIFPLSRFQCSCKCVLRSSIQLPTRAWFENAFPLWLDSEWHKNAALRDFQGRVFFVGHWNLWIYWFCWKFAGKILFDLIYSNSASQCLTILPPLTSHNPFVFGLQLERSESLYSNVLLGPFPLSLHARSSNKVSWRGRFLAFLPVLCSSGFWLRLIWLGIQNSVQYERNKSVRRDLRLQDILDRDIKETSDEEGCTQWIRKRTKV